VPWRPATSSARGPLMSTTPTRSTPGSPARILAGWRPGYPAPMTATRRLIAPSRDRPTHDRDAGLVGGANDGVAVDHERLAGIDRERRRARRTHGFDGRHADHRHGEALVLFRLGHLHDRNAGTGEPPGAFDHGV